MKWQERVIESPHSYPPCVACGLRHDSETRWIRCLEAEIRRLRAEPLRGPARNFGAEYNAIPCTKSGSVEERRKGKKGA